MNRRLPELLIIRHGETAWNRAGLLQGGDDSPLTERGVAQARALGALLGSMGVDGRTHDLIASPQGRATRTAELIVEGRGLALRPDARLREIGLGEWSGRLRSEVVANLGWGPGEDFAAFYDAAPGGEGVEAVMERAAAMLAEITRPTVLVTHGITSRCLRAVALGVGRAGLSGLPGGQGVIHHLVDGQHRTLELPGGLSDL